MTQLGEEQFLAGLENQAESTDIVEENTNIEDEQLNNEDQGGEQELDLSPIEQEAYDQGWRPQDDFKGKEGHWKSPIDYIVHGKYIEERKATNQSIDKLKQEFEDRLENTNKLNAQRNKAEIAKLKTQQREAVDMADTEAYDKAQLDIESLEVELNKDEATPKSADLGAVDPAIVAWEVKNAWINDVNDERAVVAQAFWSSFQQQNPAATAEQSLAHVDAKIGALYPKDNSNPRRDQPNTNETPRRTSQRKNRDLSMADLTSSEKQDYQMFGHTMFKTEKAFLTAVKDARAK